jgi:hypothetical protein
MIGTIPSLLDIVVDDPPQLGVVLATTATGMLATRAMTKASNSSVKPLPTRAQGTLTCRIPQAWQLTRGTRAVR